jgi:transcription termination factor Rho
MAEDLRQMTTGELAERAKQAGISNVSQMNKGEMIEALQRKGMGGSERYDQAGGGQSKKDPAPAGVDPSQYKNVPGNQS